MCTGGDPGGGTEKETPKAASRTAAPTREEMTAVRAPGQRTAPKPKPTEREVRATERRGDYEPIRRPTKVQSGFDAIQELRGRLDTQPPGMLGAIGRFSLERQIKALQGGATPVQIRTDSGKRLTVGTITGEGSYTGRPEYADIARENYKKGGSSIDTSLREAMARQQAQQERDATPPPAAPKPEPVEEVTQMGGSGTTTKKRRGRSGRRTAFGTRQSLVNLRNV